MKKERTQRGFRMFGQFDTTRGTIRVHESSAAFKGGPYCWLRYEDRLDQELSHAHLTLTDAKRLIKALQTFVDEAEAGKLTEKVQ